MSDYNLSYFKTINDEETPQANRLADLLMWHYEPKSVIDIGSATGLYLKPFMDQGVEVTGVDYSKEVVSDEVLRIPRQKIKIIDITKQPIKTRADLAICLEVMEHIPAKHASLAVKHLAATSNLIIFSAAQPGQGGVGHVNCQPKEYWQELFAQNKFQRDRRDEEYIKTIMSTGYHLGWLTNNLMVLKLSKTA